MHSPRSVNWMAEIASFVILAHAAFGQADLGHGVAPPRAAEPVAEEMKKAEELIRDLFKDDYSKKTAEDRQSLAKKLLQQGIETRDDPAVQYVLLREARDLASKSGDLTTALEAAGETARLYNVDGLALKTQAITVAAGASKTPETAVVVAMACIEAVGMAVDEDRFDMANSLLKKAETAARAAKEATIVSRIQQRQKEVDALQREAQKAKEARKALEAKPEDGGASLVLGRYCLMKFDYEQAMPVLAKGTDAKLKAAAEKELAPSGTPEEQITAGDAWREAWDREKHETVKSAIQELVLRHYEEAHRRLSGIQKTLLERRIKEFVSKSGERGGGPGTINLGGGVRMEFVLVKAGEFKMGSSDGEVNEAPIHKIKISKPFYIGKFEVTVAQFRAFADVARYKTEPEINGHGWGVNGAAWERIAGLNWRTPGFKQGDNHPVCEITWNDAQEFCKWASKASGRTVRLPTEAEWEYAARGPNSLKYPWGDNWEGIPTANVADASLRKSGFVAKWGEIKEDDGYPYTAPVGSYTSNISWCGVYDMAGNVHEWVQDYYHSGYYEGSTTVDPKGPASGGDRVLRGGSWVDGAEPCRASTRGHTVQDGRGAATGFRVAMNK